MLDDLVAQFSDPYAFARELIQNSLDAGAVRIEVRMAYADDRLVVEVVDDGEGMDRPTIEGFLLTLFRSTKEQDLTKIGKFGIGFVSLFALDPEEVVVDTGRDGVWHRVRFARDRSWTLLEMSEPCEGTTVKLVLPRSRADARHDARRIRGSAERWCRFAEAEITTAAEGLGRDGWPETPIAERFGVDAPVTVSHRADGFDAVLGPARAPEVGFYNHGLTLWEAESALVPGVSFRVKGRHLEHTLTRDNVRRDRHFDEVMGRLRALAERDLGRAVQDALAEADVPRARAIFAAVHHEHPWRWDRRAPRSRARAAAGRRSRTSGAQAISARCSRRPSAAVGARGRPGGRGGPGETAGARRRRRPRRPPGLRCCADRRVAGAGAAAVARRGPLRQRSGATRWSRGGADRGGGARLGVDGARRARRRARGWRGASRLAARADRRGRRPGRAPPARRRHQAPAVGAAVLLPPRRGRAAAAPGRDGGRRRGGGPRAARARRPRPRKLASASRRSRRAAPCAGSTPQT
ncbi:MAG: ATP-binding protein [Myxococcota bacterium]